MKIPSLALFVVISVTGCRTLLGGSTARDVRHAPVVQIDNQSSADLQVYAVSTFVGSSVHDATQFVPRRAHLGRAPAGARSGFTIPWLLLNGITPIRIVANEINGKSGTFDQEFVVVPPDTVSVSIPKAVSIPNASPTN